MLRLIGLLVSLCLLPLVTFANINIAKMPQKIDHVIYITFDGTRWQDIFIDPIYFPKLWGEYAQKGIFYGAPNSNSSIEVASVPISLPSYESQLSGAVQPCQDNSCNRIGVHTFAEDMLHQLKLNKKDIATFSSWSLIGLAVEKEQGTTFTSIGNSPVYDPDTQQADPVMAKLNLLQAADHPENEDRFDKYTFEQALHYFSVYQPRFMWISLDDADEAAHADNLVRYHNVLAMYDDMLDRLFTLLSQLKLESNTLVIVTTDHGRGDGFNWPNHGPAYPESKRTWAFVMNGKLTPISQEGDTWHYSTLSIRPTIEAALV